ARGSAPHRPRAAWPRPPGCRGSASAPWPAFPPGPTARPSWIGPCPWAAGHRALGPPPRGPSLATGRKESQTSSLSLLLLTGVLDGHFEPVVVQGKRQGVRAAGAEGVAVAAQGRGVVLLLVQVQRGGAAQLGGAEVGLGTGLQFHHGG